jgi:hypothetical protein
VTRVLGCGLTVLLPDPLERAWAGGLFEGEGTFTLKNGRYPVASLNMTDEDSVIRFHEAVGFGAFYGPYEHGRGGEHKPFWRWQVGSYEQVQQLAALLWPYLGQRRKQRAAEVLDFMKHKDSGVGVWEDAA